MGSGEFIPNGSMHWSIQHEDHQGKKTTNVPIDLHEGPKGQKKTTLNDHVYGVDPFPGPNDKIDKMHVFARFRTEAELETALAQALRKARQKGALWEVEIIIPVTPLTASEADAGQENPKAPVRVQWRSRVPKASPGA